MNASKILELLRSRHSSDVFITECKDGPTHGSRHSRLDAWAMKKSWVNPLYVGYEIKVARSDFLRDQKWIDYLPMCNELYFVSPSGTISPDETPDQAGLLWVAKTGTRLYMKKKAPYREIDPPWTVLAYILMQYGPTGFANDRWRRAAERKENSVKYWQEWLEHKQINYNLGTRVRGALAKSLIENQRELHEKNNRLEAENGRLAGYKELAELSGFSWRGREGKLEELSRMADVINKTANGSTLKKIVQMRDELDRAIKALEQG